jgi:hypothetical protein
MLSTEIERFSYKLKTKGDEADQLKKRNLELED